jgi:hypothetical protein
MEELYVEGLATHGGPESCVDDPRGRGEALAGARAGRAIEPRNRNNRGADAVQEVEGNIAGGVMREPLAGPARSENQGMSLCAEPPCARTGRAHVRPFRLVSGRAAQGTLRR